MDKLKSKVRHYGRLQLSKTSCPADPFELARDWLKTALEDEAFEPNAMTLATVDASGQPSSRIVLLKEIACDAFVFYTNYNSSKAMAMMTNPKVAATFWWPTCERQLRIEGEVSKVTAEQSDAYFASRDKDSKLGAYASEQSSIISSREILDTQFAALQEQYQAIDEIARPKHWGGYAIKVNKIEFWQGGPHRLHDRIVYLLDKGSWIIKRLAP